MYVSVEMQTMDRGEERGRRLTSLQTHKDLPVQLLTSQTPLEASIILGSTGATKGSVTAVFDIAVKLDPGHPTASPAAPLRYGKLGEIHHIFRADPKNPPKVVSLVFAAGVLATVPALFLGVSWLSCRDDAVQGKGRGRGIELSRRNKKKKHRRSS